MATFYHFNSSPKATKGAFPKILVYDINNFPLPKDPDEKSINKLEELVDKILKMKAVNIDCDTSEFDNQIDKLVYGIYNLKQKEIKLIEK